MSIEEIPQTARLIRDYCGSTSVKFNCIALREPTKAEQVAFKRRTGPRPDRKAFAIVIPHPCSVAEFVVNLSKSTVEEWKDVKDVMPTLTLEDLDIMERVARCDQRVILACEELGITDMEKGAYTLIVKYSQVLSDQASLTFDLRLQCSLTPGRSVSMNGGGWSAASNKDLPTIAILPTTINTLIL